MRDISRIEVLAEGQQLSYPWASYASVTRKGELRVYQGRRQRAFHPAGQWEQFTVVASAPAIRGARARAAASNGTAQ
jgi:hypothetical protein